MVLLRVPFALEWCMVGVGSLNDPCNGKKNIEKWLVRWV